ncbi:MAG: hypothetical protein WC586_01880 [Methanoregula sp.]
MLTLFTTPKPFKGHIGIIQENAIKSWTQMFPDCEIILFGKEEGTAEISSANNLVHVENVACNEYGTPYINSMFELAQEYSQNKTLCYVNSDIILFRTILPYIRAINFEKYLMIGQRFDADIIQSINFNDVLWEKKLTDTIMPTGKLHSPAGLDYFIFPKGTFKDIPPFSVGRPGWDNWMVYYAKSHKIPVIDGTPKILAVHQNHDYSHHKGGQQGVFCGDEAKKNIEMLGGWEYSFNAWNAEWILTDIGIKPARDRKYLVGTINAIPVLVPGLKFLNFPKKALYKISQILKKRGANLE